MLRLLVRETNNYAPKQRNLKRRQTTKIVELTPNYILLYRRDFLKPYAIASIAAVMRFAAPSTAAR